MADYTHIETQLLQRLTSDHANAQAAWIGRLSPESLRRLVVQDGSFASGVIDGLLVTTQAGTMNLQVGGGLALYYDSVVSLPDSAHRWIEVQDSAPITVTVEAADGALPRWDVVEIAPGIADGPGQVLDFYNEGTGQFVSAPAAPLKVCTPTVAVRKGTPNANPKFPAGIDGVIPLAYVYVPAAAVSLLSTDILYRRPILKPMIEEVGPGAYTASTGIGRSQRVSGGNLDIATDGTTATIHAQFSGHFSRSGQRFIMPAGTEVKLSANNYDGGLPAASNTTYFYAVPPSAVLPAGYNAYLAESELVLPTASRIASGGYASGQYHCFVVASAKVPETSQRGQPAVLSTFEISHPTMGALSISTDKAVYIGCAYYNFGALQMIAQTTHGTIVAPTRVSGKSLTVPIVADTAISLATYISGLDSVYDLPSTVRRVRILGFHRLDVQGDITVILKDSMSGHGFLKHWTGYRSNAMSNVSMGYDLWVLLNSSQQLTVNYADGNGLSATNLIRVIEWEDPVIALR